MSEETQSTPQPRRGDDHAGAAANPEQHLADAHNLSVQLQGKEGSWGHAVWALVREDKGKTKTLTVFEGTRREAVNHFFKFIHPNLGATQSAPAQRPARRFSGPPRGSRPQGTGSRPQGQGSRPQDRPTGRP